MFIFSFILTRIFRHFFIFIFIFAKDQSNDEYENKNGEDYEWQNRVDDDIVYSDDNNDGYASGQFSALDYLEHNDDVETQFSEDNNDYSGGQNSTNYNDIDEAPQHMQNKHMQNSYVDEVDEFCIDEMKHTTDGVASRKDKESRNSFIRPVAFNFEDRELRVAEQHSIVDPVNSYICPTAIHNMERESGRQRPPSKGLPLKRQMTTQAHPKISCVKQARRVTTQGQTSQALTRLATTEAQISQSSEGEEITQASYSLPVTKQAATRSTNPFAQKWMRKS